MYLFIGPSLLSGIGQVTKRYCDLVGGEYIEIISGKFPNYNDYEGGFAFVLPLWDHLKIVKNFSRNCKKMIYMTVCETEPVSKEYAMLGDCQPLYVPSQFAKGVLDSQFGWDCKILRHWAPIPDIPRLPLSQEKPYIFYTIGNVIDPRKNIKSLVNAFHQCQFPNARLVLKATCRQSVNLDAPGVVVINGLLSDDHMDKIHQSSHCYVNCSHSEGVGMGAVEAALYDKPVIIGDYGGLKEYVHTPFVIRCPRGKIGFDDFLFKADTEWGHPRGDDIVKHMRECYDRRLTRWDHSHTKDLITRVKPCLEHSL
tara:strand:- start:6719 stop:7651 length:933 start_codon:yes stop_codon:yes gene_type:complete